MIAPPDGSAGRPRGGIIALFAGHRTAANLLMALLIIGGIVGLLRLNTQFFPNFGIDVISISVEWQGASAEDVDSNIVEAIEPEVRFLDSVKLVRSTSREGFADISIEFEAGADMQAALSDVETAVDQVTTLPEDSEEPEVRRLVRYDSISRLVISGPYPEAALKSVAKRMRDELLERGIDQVTLFGAREEEIWVEISPETLRRLDLTIGDVAARIRETSQDIPSGDTGGTTERQVRSLGLKRDAAGIGDVQVRALDDGSSVRLRDVATVVEAFDEDEATAVRDGQPAIELHVQRSLNADALTLARIVDDYLAEVRPTLPPELRIEQFDVAAGLIRDRVDLLIENGLGGLVLVLAVLFLFLNARVAFWVAVGIPVSLMATLAILLLLGQSINMISLFGMILALGIIVDDAIVVAEHAETRRRGGLAGLDAAIAGARRMAAPVFSSSLTTVAAFLPLFVISDIIGQIIWDIPQTVVLIIIASLVECFLVLPGHLRGALSATQRAPTRFRRWFDGRFDRFRRRTFRRWVVGALRFRYVTIALAVASFIVSVGMLAGGRVGFNFFPSPEADKVYANAEMVNGAPRGDTEAMLAEMQRALTAVEARLTDGRGGLVQMALFKVGSSVGAPGAQGGTTGDHVGGLVVELVTADSRDVRTDAFISAWREEIRPIGGLRTMVIIPAQGGPPGRDIDVRLTGTDVASLRTAASEVRGLLERYPGVSEVQDDLPFGKPEAVLEVTDRGRSLDFATESVGRQVRDAYQGSIADRFARGDEEVTVRVKFPDGATGAGSLESLYLRAPGGAEVPLTEVVEIREKAGFASIRREDGKRQVSVVAEIDAGVTSTEQVLDALRRDGLAEIAAGRGLEFRFAGRAEESDRTFRDMRYGAVIGLITIYVILAWVFSSYARPAVVLSVVPLGFVGAMVGHYLLGYDLTILSMVALLGLSGIVINDSIILVSTVDEHLGRGLHPMRAIVAGARDRLRAVILTSATTIGGLSPLLFETSLQAQFLIPMAVTIVFGLLAATLLVLFVVPALMAVQEDIARGVRRLRSVPARPVAAAGD